MSYIYSSNSPHFLEYIASCKTREDVINDPALCVLVNDPHIKDNMELAFLAREADYGDVSKKIEFIGFFLANGPELDTDTIMFYRNKILMSSSYSKLASEVFSDITVVDELRVNKYGKEVETNDKGDRSNNCFTNPCDYLQPISAALGMIGDSENFKTVTNIFARKSKNDADDKDVKDGKVSAENKPKKHETTDGVWGNIRKHVSTKIIPAFQKGYNKMLKTMGLQMESLAEKNRNAGISNEVSSIGDSRAEEVAENISGAVKTNIFANMGDCARVWEQLRRFNPYDTSQNTRGPADTSSLRACRTPEGLPKNMPLTPTENSAAQGLYYSNSPGANASSKPLTMRETVHSCLRTEASRSVEEARAASNWESNADGTFGATSLSDSQGTSVWTMWEICAEKYGWDNAKWRAEREKDPYAVEPAGEGIDSPNIYLDKTSKYWRSYTDEESYKRIAAEYEALFGVKFPRQFTPAEAAPTASDMLVQEAGETSTPEMRSALDIAEIPEAPDAPIVRSTEENPIGFDLNLGDTDMDLGI